MACGATLAALAHAGEFECRADLLIQLGRRLEMRLADGGFRGVRVPPRAVQIPGARGQPGEHPLDANLLGPVLVPAECRGRLVQLYGRLRRPALPELALPDDVRGPRRVHRVPAPL